MSYAEFLERKRHLGDMCGFDPEIPHPFLFDFQRALLDWSLRKGRSAIFADCGLGKTPIQLAWADNVVRHTSGRVLILTPLAVADQTVAEGAKFDIPCSRSKDGHLDGERILVTNYERLEHFDPADFAGVVCDESSAIKCFNGVRRKMVTDFLRKMPYRLLCTATAAPNDYIELGTSSEALGEMGHMDMLARFFINLQNTTNPNRLWAGCKWRFKHHAELPFWRWVCSWARACRRPSDLGFSDDRFVLPELVETQQVVKASKRAPGCLFEMPAVGLKEQREELRRTLQERCEAVAEWVAAEPTEPAVVWCHLNAEADLLEQMIPDARQVSGSQTDDQKEDLLRAFGRGDLRVMVTKPKIGAWGLNWQHCSRVTFFPSHSFEQYYQAVRRCWRFGQTRNVNVHVVTTEGQRDVLTNLRAKAAAADQMFTELVAEMGEAMSLPQTNGHVTPTEAPRWL